MSCSLRDPAEKFSHEDKLGNTRVNNHAPRSPNTKRTRTRTRTRVRDESPCRSHCQGTPYVTVFSISSFTCITTGTGSQPSSSFLRRSLIAKIYRRSDVYTPPKIMIPFGIGSFCVSREKLGRYNIRNDPHYILTDTDGITIALILPRRI